MSKRTDLVQSFDVDGNLTGERVVEVIEYPTEAESVKAAARLVVLARIAADELGEEDAGQYTGLFPDWVSGIAVAVGEVYRWDGRLVMVTRSHVAAAAPAPGATMAAARPKGGGR